MTKGTSEHQKCFCDLKSGDLQVVKEKVPNHTEPYPIIPYHTIPYIPIPYYAVQTNRYTSSTPVTFLL